MDQLAEILMADPEGSENIIRECWKALTVNEKLFLKNRMHQLFKDGLPFKLEHDKLLYISLFTFLGQLEIVGAQTLLRFVQQMNIPRLQESMRAQFVDELFHSMVCFKILYILCVPYGMPPEETNGMKLLCNFIREEKCIKMALVFINLIVETWAEESFSALYKQQVAPKIFSTILEDESRHVSEAELYLEIGLPEKRLLRQRIEEFERLYIGAISMQFTKAMHKMLGNEAGSDYYKAINQKYTKQLAKIKLKPGLYWQNIMNINIKRMQAIQQFIPADEVQLTPLRQLFLRRYESGYIPTMVGQFNIDISCLDYFRKDTRFTLTLLMLQAVSRIAFENEYMRHYISYKKIYCSQNAIISMVVTLPNCGDHVGMILLKNCHTKNFYDLSFRIRESIAMMVYCYNKREELEIKHPKLQFRQYKFSKNFSSDIYSSANQGLDYSGICISNVGHWGWTQGESVNVTETMPAIMSMMSVEKKQIWINDDQTFKIVDLLPVSVNFDHRLGDANKPIPKLLNDAFQWAVQQKQNTTSKPINNRQKTRKTFEKTINKLIDYDHEYAHKVLTQLQTTSFEGFNWNDLLEINNFNEVLKEVTIS